MSVTRFAYKKYRGSKAPVISVQVLAGGRWRRLQGYVDSGAAFSVLRVAEAKRLGLFKIRARHAAVTVSGGRVFRISLHRVWVKIGQERLSITFGVPRDFDVDLNLFGRRDLFEHYRVCFDDAHATLELLSNNGRSHR